MGILYRSNVGPAYEINTLENLNFVVKLVFSAFTFLSPETVLSVELSKSDMYMTRGLISVSRSADSNLCFIHSNAQYVLICILISIIVKLRLWLNQWGSNPLSFRSRE
jgi:hypothetical protein